MSHCHVSLHSMHEPCWLPSPSNWRAVGRWEKQADPKVGKLSTPDNLGCVYAPSQATDSFCGQILRSIDARSADLENGRNLFMKKGRGVDDSIYRVCIPPPPVSLPPFPNYLPLVCTDFAVAVEIEL